MPTLNVPSGREIQRQWNALIDQAQARGVPLERGIGHWVRPPETRAYGWQRLQWLRERLGESTALSPAVVLPTPTRTPGGRRLTAPAAVMPPATAREPEPAFQLTLPEIVPPPVTLAPFVMPANMAELTFGVELECIMPIGMTHRELAAKIEETGISCTSEVYNHSLRSHWKVVTDGSLGDYTRGAEVVSPILSGESGLQALTKFCNAMKAAGCTVSRTCGLHVHVGARGETLSFFKNLAATYNKFEGVIDSVLAPSRRGDSNRYARPTRSLTESAERTRTLGTFVQHIGQYPGSIHTRGSGRYSKLNFQSFWQHGTVEFRQHQATVEAEKATNWVLFCLRLVLLARRNRAPEAETTLPGLLGAIGASEGERSYFTARQAYFEARV